MKEYKAKCDVPEFMKKLRQKPKKNVVVLPEVDPEEMLEFVPAEEEFVQDPEVIAEATWEEIRHRRDDFVDDFRYNSNNIHLKVCRKILCISDLHIPFERKDLFLDIIEEHKDADVVVVNGDLLDTYAVSSWPKQRHIPLYAEYEQAIEYMKLLSKTFPHVVLVRGNHEERLNNYFSHHVDPQVSRMVSKEILRRVANGEIYSQDGELIGRWNFKNVYYPVDNSQAWYVKVGKTVFVHPKSFSKTEGKTGVNAAHYFLEREDIDCVVCAHTHQIASTVTRGKLVIEQGCLCVPLDYEKQGKLTYRPMSLGYAVIYQDEEGNCDFNESRVYYLGVQYPKELEITGIQEVPLIDF